MTDTKEATITIDDTEYAVADLTDAARAHIANIQFVDAQIRQLTTNLLSATQPAWLMKQRSNGNWPRPDPTLSALKTSIDR